MNLSEKILHLRKQSGFSQEELADKLDVSRQTISRWELGSAQPDASNLLQLSKLFNVSADYLLNDDYQDKSYSTNSDSLKLKRNIAICLIVIGGTINLIILVASMFIKSYVREAISPDTYILIQKYSYFGFIEEHNLSLVVMIFLAMFIWGLTDLYLIFKKK